MSDHFTLDLDPGTLRNVAGRLDRLSSHVREKARTVSGTSGEIGDKWQGRAADSVKANMDALGRQMDRHDEKLAEAASALRDLAKEYDHAQDEKLPTLNRKYDEAQSAYDSAVTGANRRFADNTESLSGPQGRAERDSFDRVRQSEIDDASDERRRTVHSLETDFGYYRQYLARKTREAGDKLADAVVVPVSDAQVEEFRRRSAEAGRPSPMSIGALERYDDDIFTLAGDANYAAEGEQAAAELEDVFAGDPSDEEIDAYVDLLSTANPAFRQALVENLDPQALLQLQRLAHMSYDDTQDQAGQVVTAIAQALAKGSDPELQGDYPVAPGTYDRLFDAYENAEPVEGEGLLLLGELVHTGQGNTRTWQSDTLRDATERILSFEREMVARNEYWSWTQVNRDFSPVTEHGRESFGDTLPIDPLAMALEAMHHDPVAAQDLLTSGGHADEKKLDYLYDRKAAGYYEAFGHTLGGLLDASTQFVGDGGPGTRDHVSAEIVNDLVSHYAEHPDQWRITMDQDVIDIMTRFMPAVNHPGQTMAPVLAGDPDAPYSWQRLTLPNLDPDQLGTVMELAFATDYYTDDGSRPRYAQFAAVQAAATKADFLEYAERHGLEGGQLETLAADQGELKQRTIGWLTDAMVGQGAEADQAAADARAAADFMAGILTDTIPLDRLGGPGGAVAGAAVDGIKNAALDQWFPLTDHAGEARAETHAEEVRNRVHGPDVYLNWLDEADLLDGGADVDRYVAAHPDAASFTVPDGDGHRIRDIGEMRQEALAAADAEEWDDPAIARWEDFMRFYTEEGEPFLRDNDIMEGFQLGTLVEASK